MELSLHSPGCGLFGTYVEWEDIEMSIKNEKGAGISLGSNRSARQLGDGYGATSRIVTVDGDFRNKINGLPTRFAVKMTCTAGAAEVMKAVGHGLGTDVPAEEACRAYDNLVRNAHNREVNVYRMYQSFDSRNTKMPNFYFAKEFSENNRLRGILGLELIENADTYPIFQNLKPEDLSEVLQSLAYIEAKSLKFTQEEKRKLGENPVPLLYHTIMDSNAISKWIREMYTEAEVLRPTGELLEQMTDELFVPELTATLHEELGMKDVLVHGDLWSLNLMWRKVGGRLELCKIIDYQFAHFGSSAEDLCRLFISTLSGKDRRENWEKLIEDFCKYFEQYCDGEMPFTLEQLKESYRRMFPLAGIFLIEVLNFVPKIGGKGLSDEETAAMKEVLLEKTHTLFEDILQFAKKKNALFEENRKNLTGRVISQ